MPLVQNLASLRCVNFDFHISEAISFDKAYKA